VNRSKFTKEEVLMQEYKSLNHTKWDCKCHVVWIPKCRKKALYGTIKKDLGPVMRELARQKECEIVEGRLVADHVHMVISIPPKHAVAQAIGFIKGKSAIWVARMCG
jgi:putative transposase